MAVRNGQLRMDQGELTIVEEGGDFLSLSGAIARPGIYLYRRDDGTMFRELVPREVLQDPAYLSDYAGKPMTLLHPDTEKKQLTRSNVGKYTVGSMSFSEYNDVKDVQDVQLMLWRNDAIQAFRDGTTQLSPSYEAEIDDVPGVDPEFGYYDTKQLMRRRVNHGALVPNARGGSKMRINSDGGGVFQQRMDSSDATNADIMAAIQGTNARFDKIEARLDSMESKPTTQQKAPAVVNPPANNTIRTDSNEEYFQKRTAVEQAAQALSIAIPAGMNLSASRKHIVSTLASKSGVTVRTDASDEIIDAQWSVLVPPAIAAAGGGGGQTPGVHASVQGVGVGGVTKRTDAADENNSGFITMSALLKGR